MDKRNTVGPAKIFSFKNIRKHQHTTCLYHITDIEPKLLNKAVSFSFILFCSFGVVCWGKGMGREHSACVTVCPGQDLSMDGLKDCEKACIFIQLHPIFSQQ